MIFFSSIETMSTCGSYPAVKLTEEVDVESDIYYPITCGDTKAILVWKKFVCPGINIKCIQVGLFLKSLNGSVDKKKKVKSKKCSYCKLLWIKASAKCKSKVTSLNSSFLLLIS